MDVVCFQNIGFKRFYLCAILVFVGFKSFYLNLMINNMFEKMQKHMKNYHHRQLEFFIRNLSKLFL